MKLFRNLFATATIVGSTLATSYLYLPEAYAAIAFQIPFLPISEAIEKAAPDQAYRFKMRRIDRAAEELRSSQASLIKSQLPVKNSYCITTKLYFTIDSVNHFGRQVPKNFRNA